MITYNLTFTLLLLLLFIFIILLNYLLKQLKLLKATMNVLVLQKKFLIAMWKMVNSKALDVCIEIMN